MKFSRKIFLAVFLSSFIIGSIIIVSVGQFAIKNKREDFVSRYQVLTKVLGDTLTRLDLGSEIVMQNAALAVKEHDSQKGLLSTSALVSLRDKLGVSHLFVTNAKGDFVRSTNEDPKLIPNLFSFCDDYKNLIIGTSNVEATPIIKPSPEPKPHKFLSIPNKDRTRVIEIGMRVDFIAKTLVEAVSNDKNTISMALYSPDGTPFGRFSREATDFEIPKVSLPADFSKPIVDGDKVKFFTRVESSHPRCCQCDKAKTSKNGEYYYVLESEVSNGELKAVEARIHWLLALLFIFNSGLSAIIAKLLSRRLVKTVETAVTKVRSIRASGGSSERINLSSGDEIEYLTREFDHLLDQLETAQMQIVDAEKMKIKMDLARTVAHNIKSPAVAIEMAMPYLDKLPERTKRILKGAAQEIRVLADQFRRQAAPLENPLTKPLEAEAGPVYLPIFLKDLVDQKNFEWKSESDPIAYLTCDEALTAAFVRVPGIELKAILSNILNNARDSYGGRRGEIQVDLKVSDGRCQIEIRDQGAGIPDDYLKRLGIEPITFKGGHERGVGLVHAFSKIQSWGGKIEISSTVGEGTSIRIGLDRDISRSSFGSLQSERQISFGI